MPGVGRIPKTKLPPGLPAIRRKPRFANNMSALAKTLTAGEFLSPPQEMGLRGDEAERYPLSFGQLGLWFLDQLDPRSAAYNLPQVWRLTGPLDSAAFQAALNELVRRQESLRTTFGAVSGQPV